MRYQYGNHLDSASLELDSTGQIISYEEYFPYGDTSLIAGTNQKEVKLKEYRYTGKEKDDATGLYYYGARYYASWLGRWLSADPLFRENPAVYERPKGNDEERKHQSAIYLEGLNLYIYGKDNPIRYTDPTGQGVRDWLQSKGESLNRGGEKFNIWVNNIIHGIPDKNSNQTTQVSIMENLEYNGQKLPIPKEKGVAAIGSPVGRRDAISGIIGKHFHKGQDYKVPVGTPYLATKEGVVIDVRFKNANDKTTTIGNYITIKDSSGNISTGVHLSAVYVKPGDKVVPGQVIGLTGNSGTWTTGPHLHHSTVKGNNEKMLWDIKSNNWIEREYFNEKTNSYIKY